MVKNGDAVYFYYNEDGVRLQKTATGTTGVTKYSLHGKNIVHLTNAKNNLHFFYDARNKPAVVTFNGTAYAYLYNLQGDVIALIDSNGKKVVEYKYDAWGRILSKTGTMASTLGTLNPFRYRGYVYDEETGLYYLRSRYDNPEWARFLNADSYIAYGRINCNTNVFAYCCNTPVRCFDPQGRSVTDAALPILAGASLLDGPLPIMDGLCAIILAGLAIYEATIMQQHVSSVNSSTKTRYLTDVKTNLRKSGYEYQLAYVSEYGNLIRVGPKMNIIEATASLGVTGKVNISADAYQYNRGNASEAQRQLEHLGAGNWGIYANSQGAAKALAVLFQGHTPPEVHGSGMYGHYHDGTHTFHIWYGGTLDY